MDVDAFVKAYMSPQFKQWEETHPGEDSSKILDLIQSYGFQKWLETHPNGTVDQYISYRDQIEFYHNSSDYRVQVLQTEVNNLSNEIYELKEYNHELIEEINEKDSTIDKLNGWVIGTSISSFVLLIISICLFMKLKSIRKLT